MSDDLKAPLLGRDGMGIAIEVRKEEDKTVRLSFPASSEAPVERWFGEEILSHDKKSIRMDRINRGAMPVLFNHNWDEPIGIVDGARIENNRLVVDAHLFATARAQEIAAMVEGGLRNVSIGYRLHVVEEDKKAARYTATDWEPFEVSIVTVPADPSVGIGRQLGGDEFEVRMVRAAKKETVAEAVDPNPANNAASKEKARMADETNAAAGASAEPKIEVREIEKAPNGVEIEKGRVAAIRNLAKANKIDERTVDYWIANGIGMEGVSSDLLRILEERGQSNPQSAAALGMSKKEASQFSLSRAIKACSENNWKAAPFELDCSRQVAAKLNKPVDTQRFFVPFEVLQRDMPQEGRRDLTTASPSGGGYLVDTQNMGFIEILRNRSVAFRMGARRLSGLTGNVTIPKQSGAGSAYWLATESTQTTESNQSFSQIALTPKTASAYTEISRNLLLQSSPGAEGIVSDDLAQIVSLAVDLAALSGSGVSGQPQGITNTTGIGSVTATSVNYAKVLEFQTDVATSNVTPARGGYVTTPAAAAVLMATSRFANTDTPLWQGNVWDGTVVGFPAMSTNQLSAGMIFGDWSELVIGEWGVLEVEVNPYANFQAGIIGVRAMYSMDVGLRRAFAFSYASSVTAA
jgi:HK97 family phage major capsid protein/HK97 family phage prohead protease